MAVRSNTPQSVARARRHLEAATHVRRRHERQHPRCAGRPVGQADGRRDRTLHPHRTVGPPDVRAGLGAGLRQRRGPVGWPDLDGVEVAWACSSSRRCRRSAPERWVPWVREADVLLVDGGDATYLCHWMRESGLADLLPSLTDTVWVGVSAGSMVMTPRIGADFVQWPSAPDDRTLGVVDFSIFPHLDVFPENTMDEAERWASRDRRPGVRHRRPVGHHRWSTAPSRSSPRGDGECFPDSRGKGLGAAGRPLRARYVRASVCGSAPPIAWAPANGAASVAGCSRW